MKQDFEDFGEIHFLGDRFTRLLRREMGKFIKTLDSAPPEAIDFFLSKGVFEHGEMIADESGTLWTFFVDQYGALVMTAYPDKNGEHIMLEL